MKSAAGFLFVIIFISSCADQEKNNKTINYFNQVSPGDSAVVFAPGIVTTNHHEHSRIDFSKDGRKMYWAVIPVNPKYKTEGGRPFLSDEQNIWYSKLNNGEWTKPAIFEFTKTCGGSSPVFSGNDELFYYRTPILDADPNIRPKPSQIWQVTYENEKWGTPAHNNELLPKDDRKTFMSFCFAENGNLYFDYGGPDETGEWWWHIYFSEFNGDRYLAPVRMSNGINDGEVNWCPWIAPDESYMIYSSHREGEFGHGDLYIIYKDDDNNWMEPINMGPQVNTPTQERFPSVSPDGKFLFFARHMTETFSDIFWMDAKIITELKHNIFY